MLWLKHPACYTPANAGRCLVFVPTHYTELSKEGVAPIIAKRAAAVGLVTSMPKVPAGYLEGSAQYSACRSICARLRPLRSHRRRRLHCHLLLCGLRHDDEEPLKQALRCTGAALRSRQGRSSRQHKTRRPGCGTHATRPTWIKCIALLGCEGRGMDSRLLTSPSARSPWTRVCGGALASSGGSGVPTI